MLDITRFKTINKARRQHNVHQSGSLVNGFSLLVCVLFIKRLRMKHHPLNKVVSCELIVLPWYLIEKYHLTVDG